MTIGDPSAEEQWPGEPEAAAPQSDAQRLIAANVSVALGTLLSRLTGLLRVVVFGIIIGQNALADAYDGANNSPNSIYELLLGGVLSATLVPLFTEHLEKDDDEATNAVVSVSVIVLAAITTAAVVAAPLIFRLFSISPSPTVDADEYRQVGTSLARIFLIQIFFYGLMALGSALLQARRRFFAPAWAPVLSNLVIIAGLLLIPRVLDGKDPSLDVARDERQLPAAARRRRHRRASRSWPSRSCPRCRRAGVRLRFRPQWRHPAVRKLVTLSGWTLGYVAANQVALIVVKNLAKPGSGGQDAYSKAFTFFQLPHGLLAVSIMTTFVPDLARFVARKDRQAFVDRSSLGVRLVAFFTFPASFGLLVLARPIIGAFLQHGEFTRAGRRHHRARAGRVRARPGRLLRLPLRPARLLRPPGHPHPVRDQRRREPAEHRLRDPAGRPLRRAGPRPGVRHRLPGQCGLGAPGPVATRCRASPWPASSPASGGCCWRPC